MLGVMVLASMARRGAVAAVVVVVIVVVVALAGSCDWAGCGEQRGTRIDEPVASTGFVPPDRGERQRGVRSLQQSPAHLERVFATSDSFDSVPQPKSGDWLAEFPEPGQTYEQYESSRANLPSDKRRTLYILPIALDRPKKKRKPVPDMELLAQYARVFYQLPVRVLPEVAARAVGATRRINRFTKEPQLLTGDILKYLESQLPGDAYALIGLTVIDLYPEPAWNFVFGQASLRDRVGVYSLARYHPSFYGEAAGDGTRALVLRRGLKVLVHELGHMFGVEHCIHFHCTMNGSNHLEETDAQPLHMCPIDLRKFHRAIGFDPVARYRALGEFYRDNELDDEATWVAKRLAEIIGEP